MARARGLKLFSIPLGQIEISKLLVNTLSTDELNFVLAHEIFHIDQNHLPIEILVKLPRRIIETLGKEDIVAANLSTIWDFIKIWIYSQGSLPPEAAITKQQELQADIGAIWLTNNKTAAIQCLSKLVNNDLSQPSHLWEILDVTLPIMTMHERIREIMNIISAYENQGYRFK